VDRQVDAIEGADEHRPDPAARALGERLRWVRAQQGHSLQDVEDRSSGELKASVLGAYERGERAVSIPRLQTLAAFYGVPVSQLLPARAAADGEARGRGSQQLVIDLAALERAREQEPALARYVQAIQSRRGDWGGQVLTVRTDDFDTLAAVADASPDELRERLTRAGIVR
jgi:transcriptional regulator with XRE-family HTH domain